MYDYIVVGAGSAGSVVAARLSYDWWTWPGSGSPNDFWAQGNHGQFVYVAPGRHVVLVRFGTDYNYDHWPDLLATLARRL